MAARSGDRVTMIGPCGGGYGDPLQRDPDLVLEDVRDGYISVDQAAADYGVVIVASGAVDVKATEEQRRARATN